MYEACKTIEISDAAGEHPDIDTDEIRSLEEVDVKTELVRSNGMRLRAPGRALALRGPARHGVEGPFSELRIVAWDEYVAKVPYDIAMRPDTILAYEQDGEPLPEEDGPVRLVVGSEDGFYWIPMIARLEIVGEARVRRLAVPAGRAHRGGRHHGRHLRLRPASPMQTGANCCWPPPPACSIRASWRNWSPASRRTTPTASRQWPSAAARPCSWPGRGRRT